MGRMKERSTEREGTERTGTPVFQNPRSRKSKNKKPTLVSITVHASVPNVDDFHLECFSYLAPSLTHPPSEIIVIQIAMCVHWERLWGHERMKGRLGCKCSCTWKEWGIKGCSV